MQRQNVVVGSTRPNVDALRSERAVNDPLESLQVTPVLSQQ